MPGCKTIRVTLESEIVHAAMMAVINYDRVGNRYNLLIKRYRIRGRVFSADRKGKLQNYVLIQKIPDWFYRQNFSASHVGYISPKGESVRPLNISGLSLADRQNLLEALKNLN
jgi:hypothetical protein